VERYANRAGEYIWTNTSLVEALNHNIAMFILKAEDHSCSYDWELLLAILSSTNQEGPIYLLKILHFGGYAPVSPFTEDKIIKKQNEKERESNFRKKPEQRSQKKY